MLQHGKKRLQFGSRRRPGCSPMIDHVGCRNLFDAASSAALQDDRDDTETMR